MFAASLSTQQADHIMLQAALVRCRARDERRVAAAAAIASINGREREVIELSSAIYSSVATIFSYVQYTEISVFNYL